MVKNTGIEDNQLSDFDFGSVLKDSHHKILHALDVNQVNSLIPSKYSKVNVTRDDCGLITKIEYQGLGKQEIFNTLVREYPLGKAEITTFPFTLQSPELLDTKYVLLYDDVGSVGIQFRLDGGSLATTGADRDIICDIVTGDTTANLTTKFSTTLDSDSKFSGSIVATLAIIQSSTVGNKTNATGGDTSMTPSITDGVDSLLGKLFYIYQHDNVAKDAFYYTIDGSGVEPTNVGETATAIDISNSDSKSIIATKSSAVVNLNDYLTSTADGDSFLVTYNIAGNSTGLEAATSGFTSNTIQEGTDLTNVATILLTYDTCGNISCIERV